MAAALVQPKPYTALTVSAAFIVWLALLVATRAQAHPVARNEQPAPLAVPGPPAGAP